MTMLTSDILQRLAEPFPAKVIQWKPQATSGDKTKALAVAYIDARDVMRRLDDVASGDWGFEWEPVGAAVKGSLTVCGVTRCDVGEQGDGPMGKTIKAAVSDALKRCAVHFGVGRYLYYLEGSWVAYDPTRKALQEIPQLPKWALPGQQTTVPHDAPAMAVEEANDDAPVESDNGAAKPKPQRPYNPETVREGVQFLAANGAKALADNGNRGLCVGVIESLFPHASKEVKTAKRHALSAYLLDKESSNEWTAGEVVGLLKWACVGGDAKRVNENAPIEAERIVRQYEAEHGQQPLAGLAKEAQHGEQLPF